MALLFLDSFEYYPGAPPPPNRGKLPVLTRHISDLLARCPDHVVETEHAYILGPDLSVLTEDERAAVLRACPHLAIHR